MQRKFETYIIFNTLPDGFVKNKEKAEYCVCETSILPFLMKKKFKTKLYKLIRNSGIVKHKKRQEFIVEMLEGLIKSRSVHFIEIADKIDKPIKVSSLERRIQDFFQKVNIEFEQLAIFLLSFIHKQKLILSIDRTEWDYGGCQVNILCVVVSIGKMGVPLYFEILDNKSGNSHSDDRINLFKQLIEVIGINRIDYVVMDREFIGHHWLDWLQSVSIDFCVRVPKHHTITLPEGAYKAEDLIQELSQRYQTEVWVDKVKVNVSLSYDDQGKLLFLIGTRKATSLRKMYRKRWGIEVIFQAFKGRGFRLEESCLQDINKYKKLFALVAIAYTLCWAVGITDGRQNPVKVKKHGYPQYSVFRRGLNLIRTMFRNQTAQVLVQTIEQAEYRLSKIKTVG